MALKTGNQFLDALGGTPWQAHVESDGRMLLRVFFDNDKSDGHSTAGPWTTDEVRAFWGAVNAWESVANVRFVQVTNADAADMIERKVTQNELGSAYGNHNTPDQEIHIGQYNNIISWAPADMQAGTFTFEVFLHELGHAIGLAHPHDTHMDTDLFPGVDGKNTAGTSVPIDSDGGDNGLNDLRYTIMSYNDTVRAAGPYGHPGTPMAFDIAAIQLMYGAVENNAGDTVYTLRDTDSAGTYYSSIWDTGGIDKIEYSGSGNATIDLRAATLANEVGGGGFLSSVDVVQDGRMKKVSGGFTIAADVTDFDKNGDLGVIIENAHGGSGNDTITGNGVTNRLVGNAGKDILDGRGGADLMYGGTDDDTYHVDDAGDQVFEVLGDAGGLHDTIHTTLDFYNLGKWDKGEWVENLVFEGSTEHRGIGNGLHNEMVGADRADTLFGLKGNDTLDGGADADLMYGGEDNDIYYVDSFGDVVSEEEFHLTGYSYDAGGIDEVRTTLPFYELKENPDSVIENLTYLGTGSFLATGNSLANVITGGGGADTIDGAGGIDTVVFSGLRSQYKITVLSGTSATLADTRGGRASDGTDTISNVEFVQFKDGTVNFSDLRTTVTGGSEPDGTVNFSDDHAPVVSGHDATIAANSAAPISSLFATHDQDGDGTITQYMFMDGGTGGGHLELDGVELAALTWIPVDAAKLESVKYVDGSTAGSETLYAAAFDGKNWSENATLTATTAGGAPVYHAPVVTGQDTTVAAGGIVPITSVFSAHDLEGDNTITQYMFMDGGGGGGHLELDGVELAALTWIPVDASKLDSVKYVGGSDAGSETLYAAAFDGKDWSGNSTATMDWHLV